MIIGALQMNVVKNDKAGNLAKIEKLLNPGVDIVVLPELFSTGYYYHSKDGYVEIAEEIPSGYTTQRLIQIARKKNCHLIGAIVEKENLNLYISAVVVGPEGYVGKQRKRHLTNHELQYFICGDTSEIFEINGCRVGVTICFEGWFPESARELMLKGAQIICHTMLTCQQRTLDILRVRAIENKAYLVCANSMATEEYGGAPVTYRGDSRVIDFEGNILVNAGRDERLISAKIDERAVMIKSLEDCNDLIHEVKKHRYA